MYDIEIAVLATLSKPKFKQRIDDFSEYGLLNIKNKKVKLKLLVGTEIEEFKSQLFLENFKKDNIDYELISNDKNHVASKNYSYYANLESEDAQKARWFMKLDDDSITDISGLIDNLDRDFDHTREYFLGTKLSTDFQKVEWSIMGKYGYSQKWTGKDTKGIWHEHEASILSQSAMHRITLSTETRKRLLERSKYEEGFGDQFLAIAARIVKIYLIPANCITEMPLIRSFSLYDGPINHIHYVAHDINPNILKIIKNMKNKLFIINEEYLLDWNGKSIKFNQNGKIEPATDDAMFWYIENNTLHILNSESQIKFIFNDFQFGKTIKGKHLEEDVELKIKL